MFQFVFLFSAVESCLAKACFVPAHEQSHICLQRYKKTLNMMQETVNI